MTHFIKIIFVYIFTTLLLCGCGNQHKAEKVVTNFLDKNFLSTDYSVKFTKLDSTKHVSDSAITAMRMKASVNKMFKKNIKYANTHNQYMYIQAHVSIKRKKHQSKGDRFGEDETQTVVCQYICSVLPHSPKCKLGQYNARFPLPIHYLFRCGLEADKQRS